MHVCQEGAHCILWWWRSLQNVGEEKVIGYGHTWMPPIPPLLPYSDPSTCTERTLFLLLCPPSLLHQPPLVPADAISTTSKASRQPRQAHWWCQQVQWCNTTYSGSRHFHWQNIYSITVVFQRCLDCWLHAEINDIHVTSPGVWSTTDQSVGFTAFFPALLPVLINDCFK